MFTFVTFGQEHVHSVNGKTFDKDCVAVLRAPNAGEGRSRAFEVFGTKFCFEYYNKPPNMEHFPRGVIPVDSDLTEEEINEAIS